MKKILRIALSLILFSVSANAALAEVIISETPLQEAFTIADANKSSVIVVDANDAQVAQAAAEALASDIEAVAGIKPQIANSITAGTSPIIVGTVGQSALIDQLIASGKIDASEITGKWEAHSLQVVDNPVEGVERALVLFGSNGRGTAYAVFELSSLMGVSPYIWWADVAPKKMEAIYASGQSVIGEPSVKYRGIFINDEDWGLTPWAAKNLDSKYNNIGPNTYAKVMELLLRLRANTLWPAMHLCSEAFWANKDNLPVAKKYDIVLGSSHCEQMLRDNEWEWRRFEDQTGTYDNWNYVTNKAKIQRYWEERVAESKGFSAMYTLGMRGVHDWAISGYPTTEDKVRGLTEIISFQRSLIEKHIGDPTTVPQAFIPYKEVLEAYNAGLQIPDDVTIIWVDDNHGYIRQMPKANEQARSGGNGVYYHLSYWGTPSDYLWLCSTSPTLISHQLTMGYENGIKDLWIINIGDIKPAEAELEFCMELAWDINRWAPEKAIEFNRYWAAKTFGEEYADAIADIKNEYYRLANNGKPEHVYSVAYTYDEKDQRIADYKAIVDKVDALAAQIPAELYDAFYQMIEYPVKGAYLMNVKTLRASQSIDLANVGQRELALQYAADARSAYRQIEILTKKYNTGISNGKWNGMMDFRPRQLSQFYMPATATASSINNAKAELPKTETASVAAADYINSRGSIKTFNGLGVGSQSIGVWPLDMTQYSSTNLDAAPYVEYDVTLKPGINDIAARCVPNFPINSNYDARVAISVDGAKATTKSLKLVATEGVWNTAVLQGFVEAKVSHKVDEEKTVKVKVYLLDPGIVLSDVYVTYPENIDLTLTEELIVNYDFELKQDGTPNPVGNIDRGIPYGWESVGTLKLGANGLKSHGINQDAANLHGTNVCWINSVPMPSYFELSQTIPADKIEPGVYKVSCMLFIEENKKTSCRLFANNNVQYYGYESDYTNLLTEGEINTYANYSGQNGGGPFNLREMAVYVVVNEGESLKLGIKSGNKRNDGATATDNAGWFKVDFFRIEKCSELPDNNINDLELTKSLITNYDFEQYIENGVVKENTSGATRRGTVYNGIYGWTINGTFPGDSFGINSDAATKHATNICWFQPKNGFFSNDFELCQTIPAEKLEPGRYLVECLLWVEEGFLSTASLFANNNVQYYGMDFDYENNTKPTENNTFAGYVGGLNGTFNLQDMYVYVDIKEGEDLKLGIRTSNINGNGQPGTDYRNGWFKVDYFRIHKDSESGVKDIILNPTKKKGVWNLNGQMVKNTSNLTPGFYIIDGVKTYIK